MISNKASFRVVITGVTEDFLDDEEGSKHVVILLYLPEVEKEIIYESVPLEDFDSPEAVMDYINDIKGDAVLLDCEFDNTEGFEKLLEESFYDVDGIFEDIDNLEV
jgi:hypothetical protein